MKKNSLLIIEDDQSLCWLLNKIFPKNFKVTIKSDSIEAMYWLTDGNIPDAIISDFNMPGFNGVDFLKFLQKSGVFRQIPVIMLSGMEKKEIKEICMENGAYKFIEKPFDPESLVDLVVNTLKNRDNYAATQ